MSNNCHVKSVYSILSTVYSGLWGLVRAIYVAAIDPVCTLWKQQVLEHLGDTKAEDCSLRGREAATQGGCSCQDSYGCAKEWVVRKVDHNADERSGSTANGD